MAAALTLSPARALRRPRRIDARALAGILVTLAAFGGSLAYWTSTTTTRGVVVATHDLPAGSSLAGADLSVTQLHADDAVYEAAVPADALESLIGHQLAEPVHAHQVLARAQVTSSSPLAADRIALTIPARPDTASGGRLHPGDQVRVLGTTSDKARAEAHTRVVVERALVFDIGRDPTTSSSLGDAVDGGGDRANRGAISSVTLAVTQDEARDLAQARRAGELDIALLPPQAPAPPSGPPKPLGNPATDR
jgi:Flp pilus assembly protein CpaB